MISGKIDESTTRNPDYPRTRHSLSRTAIGSSSAPIFVVHETWYAVSACWRQWRTLTRAAAGDEATASILDPEALVLLSLTVRHRERRLQDLLHWWAKTGSTLLSVQRMRSLLAAFPESVRGDLAWFASACRTSGDRRWQALTRRYADRVADVVARPGKGPDTLELLAPSTLLLRLRAGFGVGAKADMLRR